MRKIIAVLKQKKKSRFAGLIGTPKKAFFSFYLLLHEVEYNVAWRFLIHSQENVLFDGDLDVLSILL